ncbi:MAG TPA: hypothetical protein VH914_22635 [Acidimicrobiia bacterium]|nr:hypothetical protein [Acidimicrobiia bacterium]
MRWIRALVVLVAFVLATGAVVWVSAFGFHDHDSGVDCGVPVASALHAKKVPRFDSAPNGNLDLTDACVGEARTRIGIALAIVIVSAAATTFIVRYRREPA